MELRCSGAPCFGVVRWIGWLAEHDRTGVGVELVSDAVRDGCAPKMNET